MTVLIGSILKVSIKYAYKRGDTYYYQRKIPLELQDRYGGKQHIKENLQTSDIATAARKIAKLNRQYEQTWEAMRGNGSITPVQVREAANRLLSQHGLAPKAQANSDIDVELFIETALEPKRLAYAEGDEYVYNTAPLENYLSEVEITALTILNDPPRFMLSEALEFYLGMHKKAKDEDFREYNTRIWNRFVTIVGDRPFENLARSDVYTFVARMESEGLKTGTIRRNIRSVAAIYNHGLLEKGIEKTPPFKSIRIGGEGADTDSREPFTEEQLNKLEHICVEMDDEPRWALAMQMDLGSRIGEVAGLELNDIVLETEIPHVTFEDKPWRTIKTHEARLVPLVGTALWAAKRVKESAKEGQFFAFPRYNFKGIKGKTNSDSASATLNKFMTSKGIDRTTHELRHTMRDRLRNVNATKLVMDAIGGWGKQDIGDTYGKGYALHMMQEWMLKVCRKS